VRCDVAMEANVAVAVAEARERLRPARLADLNAGVGRPPSRPPIAETTRRGWTTPSP